MFPCILAHALILACWICISMPKIDTNKVLEQFFDVSKARMVMVTKYLSHSQRTNPGAHY